MNKVTRAYQLPIYLNGILTKAKKMLLVPGIVFFVLLFSANLYSQSNPDPMWTLLGPQEILNNGDLEANPQLGDTIPAASARIHDVAISDNGQRIYVTKNLNGVWGSFDGGSTWSQLYFPAITNTSTTPSTYDFAGIALIDGGSQSEDQLFVSVTYPWGNTDVQYTTGHSYVAYSDQGGAAGSWTVQALPSNDVLTRIIGDPANDSSYDSSPSFLGLGQNNIYAYINGSWVQQHSPSFYNVVPLVGGLSEPTTWYAINTSYSSSNFLYNSTDMGKTWTAMTLSIPGIDGNSCWLAQQGSSDGLFWMYAASNNASSGVYRIVPNGNSASYDKVNITSAKGYGLFGDQGGYSYDASMYQLFAMDPHDYAAYVMVPGRNIYRINMAIGSSIIGSAFQLHGMTNDPYSVKFQPGANPSNIWIGGDQGLYSSSSLADSTIYLTPHNENFYGSLDYSIAQHPTSTEITFSATQDNGLIYANSTNENWSIILAGDCYDVAVNWNHPSQFIAVLDGTTDVQTITSYNSATSNYSYGSINGDYSNFVVETTPYDPSNPSNANVVVWGGRNLPHISTDFGHTWTAVSPSGVTLSGGISAAVVVSATEFYAGTEDGDIYHYTNSNRTWSGNKISDFTIGSNKILDLELVSGTDTLLAIVNVNVFDYPANTNPVCIYNGSSWTNISSGLPSGSIFRTVAKDPVQKNHIYAGGDQGVYRYDLTTGTWVSFFGSMDNAAVVDLQFHPTENRLLRAGTTGRGTWEVTVE